MNMLSKSCTHECTWSKKGLYLKRLKKFQTGGPFLALHDDGYSCKWGCYLLLLLLFPFILLKGDKLVTTCQYQLLHGFRLKTCEGCSTVKVWPQPAAKPCTTTHSLPQSGMKEKNGRLRVKKLKEWNKDSLIRRAKATHTRKANQGINSPQLNKKFPIPPLCMGRQFAWHGASCGILAVPLIWTGM